MKVRRGPDKPELDLSLCGKEARETRKSGGEGGERAGEEDQTPCQPSTLSLFAASDGRRASFTTHRHAQPLLFLPMWGMMDVWVEVPGPIAAQGIIEKSCLQV